MISTCVPVHVHQWEDPLNGELEWVGYRYAMPRDSLDSSSLKVTRKRTLSEIEDARQSAAHFSNSNSTQNADDLQYRARQERPQQLQDQGLRAEDRQGRGTFCVSIIEFGGRAPVSERCGWLPRHAWCGVGHGV